MIIVISSFTYVQFQQNSTFTTSTAIDHDRSTSLPLLLFESHVCSHVNHALHCFQYTNDNNRDFHEWVDKGLRASLRLSSSQTGL